MVTEFFVNLFLGWLSLLLGPINLNIPESVIESFMNYLDLAAYFVPIDTIYILFSFVIIKEGVKISFAFVKFVTRIIPFY